MNSRFEAIYRKCRRTKSLTLGREAVIFCISTIVNEPYTVEETKIGSFKTIEGYKIIINNELAFFPRSPNMINQSSGINWHRSIFLEINLVLPPYYKMGYLSSFAHLIKESKKEDKENLANIFLNSMYSEDSIASLCINIYKKKIAISPFYEQILESIQAFYYGLYRAAITTIIPCIEGIIRNIGDQVKMPISDKIDKDSFLKVLCKVQLHDIKNIELRTYNWFPKKEMNIPLFDIFNERIQMIESIKYFLEHSLYQHTKNRSNITNLNRHGIIHGLISNFNNPSNFLRLITMLNSLSITSIIAGDPGSFFHPPTTPESENLAKYFRKCKQVVPIILEPSAENQK